MRENAVEVGTESLRIETFKTHLALSMLGAKGMTLLGLAAGSFPALVTNAGRSLTFTVVSAVQGTHGYFSCQLEMVRGFGQGRKEKKSSHFEKPGLIIKLGCLKLTNYTIAKATRTAPFS